MIPLQTDKVTTGTDPFPYAIIDDLLPQDVFCRLYPEVQSLNRESFYQYASPLEKKLAFSNTLLFPPTIKELIQTLTAHGSCQMIGKLFGEERLVVEKSLNGAGIHMIERGGKLDLHLDHNRSDHMPGMERRVNAIYFMHPQWEEEWGGHLELWSEKDGLPFELRQKIKPEPNRLALFLASDKSFHGHPEPLACPERRLRASLALYFWSPIQRDREVRKKVKFAPRPSDQRSEELDLLRQLRANPETAIQAYRQ